MTKLSTNDWQAYSEAFAFIGNSLLSPMSQTGSLGLDPEFWEGFPNFGSSRLDEALSAMSAYARAAVEAAGSAQAGSADGAAGRLDPVTEASVEFTHLFVGPPRPAVAPWETMHRGKETNIGFGQATHEMRELMRNAGLKLSQTNRQYEDHMGIELLYLSVLCTRQAESDETAPSEDAEAILSFVKAHPQAWVARFREAVAADRPEGYFVRLLAVEEALLEVFSSELA